MNVPARQVVVGHKRSTALTSWDNIPTVGRRDDLKRLRFADGTTNRSFGQELREYLLGDKGEVAHRGEMVEALANRGVASQAMGAS